MITKEQAEEWFFFMWGFTNEDLTLGAFLEYGKKMGFIGGTEH